MTRLAEVMRSIDYPKFLDRNLIGHVPLIGGGLSLLVSDGVYRGAYLQDLLTGLLADLGVHTFGDLRTGEEPEQFAWSLVVTASDLSRRRLVRIPWDLRSYGIDPDEFSVARAVHASSAIPFVFEPVRVGGAAWVDGGLLSNFPVELFDRAAPRWPTFGIRLSARPGIPPTRPVHGPVSLGIAAIETLGQQSGQRLHRRPVHRATHHLRARRRGEPHRLRHHRGRTRRPVSTRMASGAGVLEDLELRGLPGGLRHTVKVLSGQAYWLVTRDRSCRGGVDTFDVLRRRHLVDDPVISTPTSALLIGPGRVTSSLEIAGDLVVGYPPAQQSCQRHVAVSRPSGG